MGRFKCCQCSILYIKLDGGRRPHGSFMHLDIDEVDKHLTKQILNYVLNITNLDVLNFWLAPNMYQKFKDIIWLEPNMTTKFLMYSIFGGLPVQWNPNEGQHKHNETWRKHTNIIF